MSKEKLVNYYDAVEKLEKTHHIYPHEMTIDRFSVMDDWKKEDCQISYMKKPDIDDISFVILDVSLLREELKQLQTIVDSQNEFYDEIETHEGGDKWADLISKLQQCLKCGMRSKIDDWEHDKESIFEEIMNSHMKVERNAKILSFPKK